MKFLSRYKCAARAMVLWNFRAFTLCLLLFSLQGFVLVECQTSLSGGRRVGREREEFSGRREIRATVKRKAKASKVTAHIHNPFLWYFGMERENKGIEEKYNREDVEEEQRKSSGRGKGVVRRGRGVVLSGGGARDFKEIANIVQGLRSTGCRLPVEIWVRPEVLDMVDSMWLKEWLDFQGKTSVHVSNTELPRGFRGELLEERGEKEEKAGQKEGRMGMESSNERFFRAVEEVLQTKFSEALLLDDSVLPLRNPSPLFSDQEFRETGALFFRKFQMADSPSEPAVLESFIKSANLRSSTESARLAASATVGGVPMVFNMKKWQKGLKIMKGILDGEMEASLSSLGNENGVIKLAAHTANLEYAIVPHWPELAGRMRPRQENEKKDIAGNKGKKPSRFCGKFWIVKDRSRQEIFAQVVEENQPWASQVPHFLELLKGLRDTAESSSAGHPPLPPKVEKYWPQENGAGDDEMSTRGDAYDREENFSSLEHLDQWEENSVRGYRCLDFLDGGELRRDVRVLDLLASQLIDATSSARSHPLPAVHTSSLCHEFGSGINSSLTHRQLRLRMMKPLTYASAAVPSVNLPASSPTMNDTLTSLSGIIPAGQVISGVGPAQAILSTGVSLEGDPPQIGGPSIQKLEVSYDTAFVLQPWVGVVTNSTLKVAGRAVATPFFKRPASGAGTYPSVTPYCRTGPYVNSVFVPLGACQFKAKGSGPRVVRLQGYRYLRLTAGSKSVGCQRRYGFQIGTFTGSLTSGRVLIRVCTAGPARDRSCGYIQMTTAIPVCTK